MEQQTFQRGQVIFKEGDASDCMYLILAGTVGIYTDYQQPGQRQLNTLRMDASFGEMGLLDGQPRSATAVAEEETTLEVVTMDNLSEFFERRPARVLTFMEMMSGNLRQLTKKYMDACRVLAEAEDAERTGAAKSAETIAGIKRFSDEYRRNTSG